MNTKQIIGFHNPDEEYGYLSNWYRSDFEKDGIRFSSMEQYMMYQKAQLKSTGDAILAECAVKDHIWGIGLSMKDPDRLDVKKWHGTNLLGYALMIVRERV